VLLVEDSPINQEVAVSLLESAGLRVDLAGNGAEAVEKACATDYDLILMDMQMPVMDGLEATQAIRRSGRTQVPIVAMTANAFGEDRQRCLDAGMNDHLPKPVDPAMLYSKLLQWLPEGQAVADAPAAPAAGTDIRSLLDQVPGLDAAYGLKNLRGRVPNYLRLLRKYADGHADDGGRIRAGLAAGNMDEVRRLAHSLKGVAGMIGATGVQGLAAELEAAIREALDAATIEARLAAVEEAQAATVAAIYRLPDADAVAAAQDAAASAAAPDEAAQAAAAEETLRSIEALLGEGNVLVMKQAREAAPLIRSALGDAAAGFEQALAAYDFPAALACLRSRKP
jgi:two-component system sensor histidine kinase/response regulator